jgi:hypothetical protein
VQLALLAVLNSYKIILFFLQLCLLLARVTRLTHSLFPKEVTAARAMHSAESSLARTLPNVGSTKKGEKVES